MTARIVCLLLTAGVCLSSSAAGDDFVRGVRRRQSKAEILWTKPICKETGRYSYIGWPTVCRRKSGELIAVFSGGRLAHVCPYGKVQLVRSFDGGETWSDPETVRDSTLDDRDAGITELDNGDLLLVSFTSVCYQWRFKDEYAKVSEADRKRDCGYFSLRSADGGKTWEAPMRMHSSANHGAVQLKDGRVLLVGRRRPDGGNFLPEDEKKQKFELTVEESTDRGRSWHVLANLVPQAPYVITKFHEPHLVEAGDGRLIAMFRHHGKASIVQCVSTDGGRTWGPFEDTKIVGLPPHLMRCATGEILCTTALRSDKRGVELVTVSRDDGKTWELAHAVELALSRSADMGYPSTVQNADGTLVTVYYQQDKVGEKPCLMATKWRMMPYDAAAEKAFRQDERERRAKQLPTRPGLEFLTDPPGAEIRKMSNGLQVLKGGAVYRCRNIPVGAEIESRFLLSFSVRGDVAPALLVGGREISFRDLTDDAALLGDLIPVVVCRKDGELSVTACGKTLLRTKDASAGALPIAFKPGTGSFSMCNGTVGARKFETLSEALANAEKALASVSKVEGSTVFLSAARGDTLETGRDAARALKRKGLENVTVELTGYFARPKGVLTLDAEDSDVTWRASSAGATVSGAVAVPKESFLPVAEAGTRNRLKPSVRDRVRVADLAKLGVERLDPLPDQFRAWPSVELFARGKAQTIARYPDRGFLSFTNALDRGAAPGRKRNESCGKTEGGVFQHEPDAAFSCWDVSKGVWMFGFWSNDWYSESLRVKSIDPATRAVAMGGRHQYGVGAAAQWQKAPRRYYVFNLLEELDAPGEWYLDADALRLYWLPPDGDASGAELTFNPQPLVLLRKAKNVTFEGVSFVGSRAPWAVEARDCENVTFRKIEMRDLSGSALTIWGGRNCLVADSHITRLGVTGLSLRGGDRRTLTPGGHRVTGCEISHTGRLQRNGGACIRFEGVGMRIDRNYLHDVPYIPMSYTGNDHVIEKNEIAFGMMESGDGGAVYTGRDWGSQGTVVRGNWIHHLGKDGVDFEKRLGIDNGFVPLEKDVQVSGVYLDDCDSGETVTNNLFYKAGWATIVGGGRDNVIADNLAIEGSSVINFDVRGEVRQRLREWKRGERDPADGWDLIRKIEDLGYDQEPWRSRYPQLLNVMENHPEWPMGCVFTDNLALGCKVFMNSYGKSAPLIIRDHLKIANNVAYGERGRFDKIAFPEKESAKVRFEDAKRLSDLLKKRDPLAIQDDPAFRRAFPKFPKIAIEPSWRERAKRDRKGYEGAGGPEDHVYGGWL